MIRDAINSITENVKERITNPFLGTFILVWLVHNWSLVYSFFYFDKNFKLNDKIEHFNKYWQGRNFFWNLILVALISILILIITYIFLTVSRYLARVFENMIVPYINSKTKGKIVTLETYEAAINRINILEEKIELERRAKNEAIDERDEFERKLYEKNSDSGNSNKDSSKLYLYPNLINLAKQKFDSEKIEDTLLGISKGQEFHTSDKVIDFLLGNGLIKLKSANSLVSRNTYQFTAAGTTFMSDFSRDKT